MVCWGVAAQCSHVAYDTIPSLLRNNQQKNIPIMWRGPLFSQPRPREGAPSSVFSFAPSLPPSLFLSFYRLSSVLYCVALCCVALYRIGEGSIVAAHENQTGQISGEVTVAMITRVAQMTFTPPAGLGFWRGVVRVTEQR